MTAFLLLSAVQRPDYVVPKDLQGEKAAVIDSRS
jgi:hypothetical protein